jgi:SAM-dependent methyltransferase
VGVDGGAAKFKNRHMFHTSQYYGIDIDLSRLRDGFAHTMPPNTYGIHADLAHLDPIPTHSADVVVSTNTLYALMPQDRKSAIDHLSRITKSGGVLVIQLSLDAQFEEIMSDLYVCFEKVEPIYYQNPISRMYETLFEQKGFLGAHPVAGSKPFLALAWLFSRFEYLTCRMRFLNKHVLIRASQQREKSPSQSFDLGDFPLIDGKIYEFLVNK